MFTAILISCLLVVLKEVLQTAVEHIIKADNEYENTLGLLWIGWYITVFVFCIKLIKLVNN